MNETSHDSVGNERLPAVTGTKPTKEGTCCKVRRVADAYDLSGIDVELRRRYEDEGATLHDLADYLNDRITAATVTAVNDPVDAEPATVRAALNGVESISPTERDDIRADLAGRVDVGVLTGSFVSHETIRQHLNEHLDVSTSTGGFETLTELTEGLTAYETQYRDGIEGALRRAGSEGLLNGEEFTVFSTRVECGYCSEMYRLEVLLDNRGCDCRDD